MKKVLVISSSLRPESNSEKLAIAFTQGARDAGNDVEFVSLKGKRVAACFGCFACLSSGKCVVRDDATQLCAKLKECDAVCFATPVYYYGMSGLLKLFLDRMNPLFSSDYRFRDVYCMISAAENKEKTPKGAVTALEGWIDCFEHARLAGTVFAGGVNEPGEIAARQDLLNRAYELGKNC